MVKFRDVYLGSKPNIKVRERLPLKLDLWLGIMVGKVTQDGASGVLAMFYFLTMVVIS